MADTLAKLFGSNARLKLLRLFLFNPKVWLSSKDIIARSQVSPKELRQELAALLASGILRRQKRGRTFRYMLKDEYPHLQGLRDLLLDASTRDREIVERMRAAGRPRLIVVSGLFAGDWDNSIDLLVVGDRMDERKFSREIRRLEAEIGKEIRYALMRPKDFLYQLNVGDRVLRDVFDFRHRILLDRFDIGLK